jgi:uncharacterized membrane protein
MNAQRKRTIGLMFMVLGLALSVIFRGSLPGTGGGLLFMIAGIVLFIKSRAARP